MIVDLRRGDVLTEDSVRDIVFALNTTGLNFNGFAGKVTDLVGGWPEVNSETPLKIGEVYTRSLIDHDTGSWKTFHGGVVHDSDRWYPRAVTAILDGLAEEIPEPFAVLAMGTGVIGQMSGADPYEILAGMARSKARVVVWTL